MSYISVCKNVIVANNKRGWQDPEPAIRVSITKSGKAVDRSFHLGILDKNGALVAEVQTTRDGKPILKCGAKVAIEAHYDVVNFDTGEKV